MIIVICPVVTYSNDYDSPSVSNHSLAMSALTSSSTTSRSRSKRALRKLQPAWRSPVWEFFSVAEDTKFAEYYKCKDLVAHDKDNTKGFNTNNLVQYLKSKHSEEYSDFLQLKQKKETERASIR